MKEGTSTAAPASASTSGFGLHRLHREIGVMISLVVVAVGFRFFSGAHFLEASTWGNILLVAAELGIVAVGATLLMIAGEFDLSIGSNFAFSGMMFALMTIKLGISPWAAFPAVLAVAAFIGLVNALVTISTGIPSFISTLGALLVWRGLVLAVSEGWPLSQVGDSSRFMNILAGSLSENFSVSVLWWLAIAFLAYLILNRTVLGNWIMAVGGNAGAARAAGVPVTRVKIFVFMLASLLAGFAGMIEFSRLGSFSPTYGEGMELEAIVAAVIGGTLLTGGVGGVLGTVLGTVLIGMISSGLVLSGAPVYWFRTFVGIILVLAVILNRFLSEKVRAS